MADGFSSTMRIVTGQPGAFEVGGDGLEQIRRVAVVDPHAAIGTAEVLGQTQVVAALGGVHGEVVDALGEGLPVSGLKSPRATCARQWRSAGPGSRRGRASCALGENPHVGMQAAVAVQVIQRRKRFVQRQVTGPAEHEHVTGNRHRISPVGKMGSSRTLGKSELTVREAGKLAVAKHTLHLSLLSPCILLILPRSGQAMTSLPAVHLPTTPF